jgi:hypothetical protein
MKHDNDNQWLDPLLAQYIGREPEQFDFDKWAEKHPDETRLLRSGFEDTDQNIKIKPNEIWRFIMESKVTKYSAAAVVALAITLVLLSPFGPSKNGSIVLAEVVDKVSEMHTVIFKEKYLFWEINQEESYLEANATKFNTTKYAFEGYGVAEDAFDDEGALIAQVYTFTETKQFILVLPAEKKYGKLSMPGDWLNRMTGILTPRGFLEYFTSGQYTELGRAKFDNFDVEGFEISDPNIVFPIPEPLRTMFPVNDMVVRIWIDVETSLPVGVEAEFNTDSGLFTGFKKLHCEYRAKNFQWNTDIPEGIFEPNIPDDYTEIKVTDFIPTEAKAGLVGLVILPVGFIFWKRHRKQKKTRYSNKIYS